MHSIRLFALATAAGLLASSAIAGNCTASKSRASRTARADIVDTALGAGSFATLTTALARADLVFRHAHRE